MAEQSSDMSTYFQFFPKALEGVYGPFLQTIGIVLFVLLFNFAIKNLLLRLSSYYEKKNNIWALSFFSGLQPPLAYFVGFVAIISTCEIIVSQLFSFHIPNLHHILTIGGVLAFGWFILRWKDKLIHYMWNIDHPLGLSRGKLDLIGKVGTISVVFIMICVLMEMTGRNMQTLITFGGIGGLALAFASQQMVSNFFGGLMIYITQPFSIGEVVCLPERKIEGTIEEIGWYLTLIRNFEKRPIYVPNSIFTQTIVITPSRMSHDRIHHTIGLRYKDINVVPAIIEKIKLMLLKHPDIDKNLLIEVFFINFGPATLDVEISAFIQFCGGVSRFPKVRQEVLLKIADIIVQEGAEIATPTNVIEFHENSNFSPQVEPNNERGQKLNLKGLSVGSV